MKSCVVLLKAALLLLHLCGSQAYRLVSGIEKRFLTATEINCMDLPMKSTAITPIRIMSEGFRIPRQYRMISAAVTPASVLPVDPTLNTHEIQKRFDHLFGETDDLVKEHAKLLQDINSLRQVVFVAPLGDETRDYEDSIYHEIIETTTTPKPTASLIITTAKPKVKPTSFPVFLVGGASQRQTVRASPITPMFRAPKPTISLIGSSVSPLARHPYPFVSQASSLRPFKICMPPTPMMMPTTTRRPTLWNRLLSFFPGLAG